MVVCNDLGWYVDCITELLLLSIPSGKNLTTTAVLGNDFMSLILLFARQKVSDYFSMGGTHLVLHQFIWNIPQSSKSMEAWRRC
jgi:hypothetical protein